MNVVAGLAAAVLVWPVAGAEWRSGPQPVALLELYTSEGCSSCPPAEAWMGRLRQDAGLWKTFVPVVFHVDYWDKLGWKDPWASADHSRRQRRYAAQWGSPTVYTPGMVLGGREWRDWHGDRGVPDAPAGAAGKLVLREAAEGRFYLDYAGSRPASLHAAVLGMDMHSAVQRGENSGRTLEHHFVVLQHVVAAPREAGGRWEAEVRLAAEGAPRLAVAAWAEGEGGRPQQAVGGYWNPETQGGK